MKILYAIQGTGNGHVSRAREIIPHLKNHGDVEILISGTQAEVGLEQEIKYRFNGFGFVFGEKGGVDFRKTWHSFHSVQFMKDVRSLPVKGYDLVINDFEPVTAWACKLRRKKSVALSHQSAYLSPKTPQLSGFHWGKWIMNNYAPATHHVAFHFEKYDDFIHTPVIRSEIREIEPRDQGHFTVYLPAYGDKFILDQVSRFKEIKWHIFSKHTQTEYSSGNADVFPINNAAFQHSLANCSGLLTGGGFEGPAEALFLGKKVLAVPMQHQYEQQCNALAMENMGVTVIWNEAEFASKLSDWVSEKQTVQVNYPDDTAQIISALIEKYRNI